MQLCGGVIVCVSFSEPAVFRNLVDRSSVGTYGSKGTYGLRDSVFACHVKTYTRFSYSILERSPE